ncbi:MAG: hypothetical protein KME03_17235 [Aphanocapsa lilacina HA4352-LM1]|nr:hypothetical protein [Aphanocapsa lilacina HA4352-LM1]
MTIFWGLAIALLGATSIACGVFGLSNLYVARWMPGWTLLAVAVAGGLGFARAWEHFLSRLEVDDTVGTNDRSPPPAMPAAPALLSSFWLMALAGVLWVGALASAGAARLLSAATAAALALAAVLIFLSRPRRTV